MPWLAVVWEHAVLVARDIHDVLLLHQLGVDAERLFGEAGHRPRRRGQRAADGGRGVARLVNALFDDDTW